MADVTTATALWQQDGSVCQGIERNDGTLEIQQLRVADFDRWAWRLEKDQAITLFEWLSQTPAIQESEALVQLLLRFQERRSSYVGD